ncbi:hypothetical protein MPUL_43140 [Mycolicibacterium pulveris]|uniref:Transketolase C-terminal domain-containing protein n=1 Tax=Mycolicibacterium pulveris TaxID=36813 RepID=A0A7I7USX3_MYCPV|nr:hypothetical protein MPUL_43140 [Mycolicibacterium pulveris]
MRVVACADPAGAYELLRAAIACDDPVIFYEPKRRYWDSGESVVQTSVSPAVLDSARVLREGADATVFCYGGTVALALGAADVMAGEGKSLEVVDLQSLSPLDTDALTRSAAKTGRVVVVHEAPLSFGVGAMDLADGEIGSQVTAVCGLHANLSVVAAVYDDAAVEEFTPDELALADFTAQRDGIPALGEPAFTFLRHGLGPTFGLGATCRHHWLPS